MPKLQRKYFPLYPLNESKQESANKSADKYTKLFQNLNEALKTNQEIREDDQDTTLQIKCQYLSTIELNLIDSTENSFSSFMLHHYH